jgi:hypothetical protein
MANEIAVGEAIKSLNSDAQFSIMHNDDGDVYTWITDEIPQADIDAEQARLQAVYDSQAYARNRKAEYDQLNQFEMQFDDDRDSTSTWVDTINEIKGRHPK